VWQCLTSCLAPSISPESYLSILVTGSIQPGPLGPNLCLPLTSALKAHAQPDALEYATMFADPPPSPNPVIVNVQQLINTAVESHGGVDLDGVANMVGQVVESMCSFDLTHSETEGCKQRGQSISTDSDLVDMDSNGYTAPSHYQVHFQLPSSASSSSEEVAVQ